jgi:TPP-dependent pyruvate/acetoin dehydrogenase alpha subunit
MYDPDLYRSKDEIAGWKQHDPIDAHVARMREDAALDDEELAALEADIKAQIDAAVDAAEAGTLEPVEELERFVYAEEPAT